jgi:hypothetical protein
MNESFITMEIPGIFSIAGITRRLPIRHHNSQILVNDEDEILNGVKNTIEQNLAIGVTSIPRAT